MPLEVNAETHPPPELKEFDVMMALSKIKKLLLALMGCRFGFGGTIAQPSRGDSCALGVHLSKSGLVLPLLKSAICLRKAYIFQEFAEGLLSICVC